MSVTNGGAPKTELLLDTVITDESLSPWIDVRGYSFLVFYCRSVGTGVTSSGVLSFEECGPATLAAPQPPVGLDTGKYSVITTTNASSFTGTAEIAVHCSQAAYCYVRARVSTVIGGGGAVTVYLVAY